MSNYHYYEGGCKNCLDNGNYTNVTGISPGDECLPACMNRFSKERSVKDQMDYQTFVIEGGLLNTNEQYEKKDRKDSRMRIFNSLTNK